LQMPTPDLHVVRRKEVPAVPAKDRSSQSVPERVIKDREPDLGEEPENRGPEPGGLQPLRSRSRKAPMKKP